MVQTCILGYNSICCRTFIFVFKRRTYHRTPSAECSPGAALLGAIYQVLCSSSSNYHGYALRLSSRAWATLNRSPILGKASILHSFGGNVFFYKLKTWFWARAVFWWQFRFLLRAWNCLKRLQFMGRLKNPGNTVWVQCCPSRIGWSYSSIRLFDSSVWGKRSAKRS